MDELDKALEAFGAAYMHKKLHGEDFTSIPRQAIEAYISKHYIKKADVLEAIGENESYWGMGDVVLDIQMSPEMVAAHNKEIDIRNQQRAEIKEKLTKGE